MHGPRLLWSALACLAVLPPPVRADAVPVRVQPSGSSPAQQTAESSAASLERVIGVVTATGSEARQLTVKADAGGAVTVILEDATLCLRVPPGETDLKKAVKITFAEIGAGDRVLVRGRLAEDRKSIPAASVIVMTKADLTKARERELSEWQKRAVAGTITALNPGTQEIKLAIRAREGTQALVIERSAKTVFRRYAADSVQFAQAKPSSFAELRVGDAVRMLGKKNPDGTRITPEEIVSGSFRNVAGIVEAVDISGGEIRITDLQAKKPLTVRITSDTVVRRMPATKPAPAGRPPERGGGAAASGGAGSVGRAGAAGGAGATGGAGTANGPGSAGRAAGPSKLPAAGGGGPTAGKSPAPSPATGGGLVNLDRMPAVPPGELKRGEAIIVLCTVGAEPSRVTAIVMVAGVETLLGPAAEGQAQLGSVWNFFDVSLP